jgi:hypothetical protein
VGKLRFTDGEVRIVYEHRGHRQFVLDDDLEPVYRVWILLDDDTADAPMFIDGAR